jgi:hypothetical protein
VTIIYILLSVFLGSIAFILGLMITWVVLLCLAAHAEANETRVVRRYS